MILSEYSECVIKALDDDSISSRRRNKRIDDFQNGRRCTEFEGFEPRCTTRHSLCFVIRWQKATVF